MKIKIVEETPAELAEYEKVPIAFKVETIFRIEPDDFKLIEEPVAPYTKDYDSFESERPSFLAKQFDLSNWGIFAAFDENRRIGGAIAARRAPELEMLEGRDDLACLWDLRVDPDHRNKKVGRKLFSAVVDWARARDCRGLKIETQNTNVAACKFYARQGCRLREINKYAYDEALNEIQLIWYLDL